MHSRTCLEGLVRWPGQTEQLSTTSPQATTTSALRKPERSLPPASLRFDKDSPKEADAVVPRCVHETATGSHGFIKVADSVWAMVSRAAAKRSVREQKASPKKLNLQPPRHILSNAGLMLKEQCS